MLFDTQKKLKNQTFILKTPESHLKFTLSLKPHLKADSINSNKYSDCVSFVCQKFTPSNNIVPFVVKF